MTNSNNDHDSAEDEHSDVNYEYVEEQHEIMMTALLVSTITLMIVT